MEKGAQGLIFCSLPVTHKWQLMSFLTLDLTRGMDALTLFDFLQTENQISLILLSACAFRAVRKREKEQAEAGVGS